MALILFAFVVRVRDGLPLSASTDFQHNRELQERKQQLKVISKSLSLLPERGIIKGHELHIYFLLSEGVAYLMVGACSLPAAVAFCFLEDLRWEFTASFDNSAVALATRPYPFLEFDSVIQKLQQHYNQSGGPSLGVTLAEVQEELRASPPQILTMEDVQLSNGAANGHIEQPATSGQNQRLEPISAPGILSLVLNIMCAALNLIRGVHLIEYTFQDDYDGIWNVVAFLLAFVCCVCQDSKRKPNSRHCGAPWRSLEVDPTTNKQDVPQYCCMINRKLHGGEGSSTSAALIAANLTVQLKPLLITSRSCPTYAVHILCLYLSLVISSKLMQ